MTHPSRRRLFVTAAAALASLTLAFGPRPARAQAAASARKRAVFQVSDADPARWNLALNNVKNAAVEFGPDTVELELVAYGPGIGMLQAGSPVAARVSEALKSGVKVVACENTMQARKLVPADMLADIGYVPSGVGELMKKQFDGWAYIRP